MLQNLARVALLLPILALPLLWGGRHLAAVGLAGVCVLVSLFLWLAGALMRGHLELRPARGLLLFVPVLVVGLLQCCPWAYDAFAPEAVRALWEGAREASDPGTPLIALDPAIQRYGLAVTVLAGLFYFLAVELFQGTRRTLILLVVLALASGISAAVGLWQFTEQEEWLLFIHKTADRVASGGFFNRNHFADFCTLGFFVSLGLITSFLTSHRGSGLIEETGRARMPLLAVLGLTALLTALGVIFSYSRAGTLSAAGALLLFLVWMGLVRRGKGVSVPLLILVAVLVVAGFHGLELVADRLGFALSGEDSSALIRLELWQSTLEIIRAVPWTGAGFAAVRALLPSMGTGYMPGFISADAHNDYLDLLAIIGIPAAAAVFVIGAVLYVRLLKRLAGSERRISSWLPVAVGGLCGITAVLCHESVEYGLKQPALLIGFCALCAATTALAERVDEGRSERPAEFKGVPGAVVAVILLVADAALLPFYGRIAGEGIAQARVEQTRDAMAATPQLSAEIRARTVREASLAALEQYPSNTVILTTAIDSTMDFGDVERRALIAKGLSQILDSTIEPTAIDRPAYSRYRAAALDRIPSADKAGPAAVYAGAADLARRLADTAPSNALDVSMVGQILEEESFWSGKPAESLPLHAYALKHYPTHTTVLSRALRGYVLAAMNEKEPAKRAELVAEVERIAEALVSQDPREVQRVLPLIDAVLPAAAREGRFVPENVTAMILYADWLESVGEPGRALGALEIADGLNQDRLEEENPWTMGRLEYLARERRSKIDVAKLIEEKRLRIFNAGGDSEAGDAAAERLRELRRQADDAKIERADELLAAGQWALAEEVLVRIGYDDPRALVRRAEMAAVTRKVFTLSKLLEKLETLEDVMDDDTRSRYEKLRSDRGEPVTANTEQK
ncbi:O-antigen ligase [Sutterella sp.]|uniref:O-antigen ligase family protein n=1 Tax=Sutterella sp. TaxID=1981025 RepID=UPI0026DF0C5A|nr:O-antigen ligase family protein [Sutterella sp.]MDO5530796.1 O-antigen ligase family protein [Sutterella sp.]